jgi:hypothetical protein
MEGHSGCHYRVQISIRDRIVGYTGIVESAIRTGVCFRGTWEPLQDGIVDGIDVVISGDQYYKLDRVLSSYFLTSIGDHGGPNRFRRLDPPPSLCRRACIGVTKKGMRPTSASLVNISIDLFLFPWFRTLCPSSFTPSEPPVFIAQANSIRSSPQS